MLIVAGTLTTKMAGPLLRLWEQMPEPKWCVAMGDCTCSGGRYKRSYSVVQGIDRIMPVDVYVPGCPPRPEGLIYGMMKLQQLIAERRGHWAERAVGPRPPLESLPRPLAPWPSCPGRTVTAPPRPPHADHRLRGPDAAVRSTDDPTVLVDRPPPSGTPSPSRHARSERPSSTRSPTARCC